MQAEDLDIEEALPAGGGRRAGLPGRRRAGGGLLYSRARGRPAVVALLLTLVPRVGEERRAARREGRRRGGLVELGRRGHGGRY